MSALAIYLALGLAAGLLAGLLGVGGGLVLVAALAWLLPTQGIPAESAMHAALATSLATIVLTGLASARAHHHRGSVRWASVRWLVPGLLLGGWVGSAFAITLDGATLRLLVAGYCFVAAAQLLFGQPRARPDGAGDPAGPWLSVAGVAIGAVSAVVGIGGGSMTVPLLIWLGVVPVRAVGSSSACGVAIAVASAAGYALQAPADALPGWAWGYVYLPAALGVAATSVFAAPWGSRLAHSISGTSLRRVFAGFLAIIGASLLW